MPNAGAINHNLWIVCLIGSLSNIDRISGHLIGFSQLYTCTTDWLFNAHAVRIPRNT